jgi:acetolactate synthase-1/2/3 large subunit
LKVNDYIAQRLNQAGVTKVYGLVGGSTAGLNDGFIKNPNIDFIAFHHEQGAGHAAVGSARTNNRLSVCNVTAGCGVTNAMTSLLNAYEESAPVLFLSGNTAMSNQAKYINRNKGIQIRKYGIQDLDALQTVKHICKYAVAIERAEDVPYALDCAIHLAESGRPGPVWIDVPGNLQSAEIPEGYPIYQPTDSNTTDSAEGFPGALEIIQNSLRPVIVAGNGINLGNARSQFRKFVDRYQIPFVTTFLSRDLIAYEHPQNLGMIGVKGARAANFAMQNADCLIILGCSMNVTHIGYDTKTFSPASKKIMVDIDANELGKDVFKVDLPINGDVKDFFDTVNLGSEYQVKSWADRCQHWKTMWPIYDPEVHRSDEGGLNLYEIVESINRNMQPNDCFVVDAGQPCYVLSSNGKYKENCRYMAQAAQGDMGYAVPASVGVHFADPKLNITLVIGEGSFYTNLQELAVIRQHNIPVKIFVINNDGYMSIKQTQDKFFGGRRWGVSNSTGVYFADIGKIATAFEIPYVKISNNQELDQQMSSLLRATTPIIVEFISQNTLDVLPAQAFKPDGLQGGLHDMSPFLPQAVLDQEMIVQI